MSYRSLAGKRMTRLRNGGFSLIEVVMAIGITAFAAFAIAGLIPLGMASFSQSKSASVASQISRQIFSEVQSTPFTDITNPNLTGGATYWNLPAPNNLSTTSAGNGNFVRYFNDQGEELAAAVKSGATTSSGVPAGTIYEANVGVRYANYIQSGATSAPMQNNCLVIITVQVAVNPGHLALDMNPNNSSLWGSPASSGLSFSSRNGATAVQVFSYQTMLAGDAMPNI